jgi:hypothetical protein
VSVEEETGILRLLLLMISARLSLLSNCSSVGVDKKSGEGLTGPPSPNPLAKCQTLKPWDLYQH